MASGPITSWQIDGETMEAVADFIFFPHPIPLCKPPCRQHGWCWAPASLLGLGFEDMPDRGWLLGQPPVQFWALSLWRASVKTPCHRRWCDLLGRKSILGGCSGRGLWTPVPDPLDLVETQPLVCSPLSITTLQPSRGSGFLCGQTQGALPPLSAVSRLCNQRPYWISVSKSLLCFPPPSLPAQ